MTSREDDIQALEKRLIAGGMDPGEAGELAKMRFRLDDQAVGEGTVTMSQTAVHSASSARAVPFAPSSSQPDSSAGAQPGGPEGATPKVIMGVELPTIPETPKVETPPEMLAAMELAKAMMERKGGVQEDLADPRTAGRVFGKLMRTKDAALDEFANRFLPADSDLDRAALAQVRRVVRFCAHALAAGGADNKKRLRGLAAALGDD